MRPSRLCLALLVLVLLTLSGVGLAQAQDPVAPARDDPTGMSFISSLRARSYGGGEMERVRVLAETPDFTRYLIRYPSDGLTIQGFMNVPTGVEPPYRVVVVAHGYVNPDAYPLLPYTTPYADALASAGFLVVHPGYRNHTGSDDGPNPFRSGYTIDVLNLVALLKQQPDVRPDAIGLFGHSMGGEVTIKALVVRPQDIHAAVLYGAMGADAWENWNLINWKWAGGWFLFDGPFSPWRDRAAFRLASPSAFLADVAAPIQIHHGTADDTAPYEWATDLHQRLLDAGKPAELYSYRGAGHSFWTGSAAYNALMARSIAFFDAHLRADP